MLLRTKKGPILKILVKSTDLSDFEYVLGFNGASFFTGFDKDKKTLIQYGHYSQKRGEHRLFIKVTGNGFGLVCISELLLI
jgi:hypothetical protein